MPWWIWLIAGLALLGVELLTPGGFFVVFFGVGALAVGLLVGSGLAVPLWAQWLAFSVVSLGSMVLLRGRLVRSFARGPDTGAMDSLAGEIAVLEGDLAPGAIGKAELRGTTWNVRNVDAHPLGRGQRCRVERVEGLTLAVRAESPLGG